MFKTKKDIKITEQNSKIENQDKYIRDLKSRISLKEKSNDRLRSENTDLIFLISKIANLVFKSPLSDELIRAKLKELTRYYQSEN